MLYSATYKLPSHPDVMMDKLAYHIAESYGPQSANMHMRIDAMITDRKITVSGIVPRELDKNSVLDYIGTLLRESHYEDRALLFTDNTVIATGEVSVPKLHAQGCAFRVHPAAIAHDVYCRSDTLEYGLQAGCIYIQLEVSAFSSVSLRMFEAWTPKSLTESDHAAMLEDIVSTLELVCKDRGVEFDPDKANIQLLSNNGQKTYIHGRSGTNILCGTGSMSRAFRLGMAAQSVANYVQVQTDAIAVCANLCQSGETMPRITCETTNLFKKRSKELIERILQETQYDPNLIFGCSIPKLSADDLNKALTMGLYPSITL